MLSQTIISILATLTNLLNSKLQAKWAHNLTSVWTQLLVLR